MKEMQFSNKSQAENGVDNTTIMTPLRVKQSIKVNAPGGGGGTSDYEQLSNLPKINSVELRGNKTTSQLGIKENVQANWTQTTVTAEDYIKNKPTIPTATSQLTNDSNFVTDASYVHTDNNYTTTEKTKLSNIEAGAEKNVIESIEVDGTPLTVTNKTVNITGKQDTLVSGTTIKTVNNQSLLGSGNITIQAGNTYYYDGTNSAANVAMLNEICSKYDNNEEIVFSGSFMDYATGQRFQAPINVVKYSVDPTFNQAFAFVSDPVAWLDETTSPAKLYYFTFALSLTGSWGAFTGVSSFRLDTMTPEEWTAKQDALVSGTTIKTINSQSLLGSGDISVLTTETDPIFSSSVASTITSTDISNWNAAEANVQADWSQSDNTKDDYIKNKPTIPTVNNGTLTIQKNGTTVKTFTANSSSNVTANITVPTKTSDLTNDDNVVKDASYVHTDNNYTTSEQTKLSGIATGAEVNVQSDWNETDTNDDAYIKNKPTIPTVPTNVSAFTNDAGYLTSETDPVFSASEAANITSSDTAAWTAKQDALVSGTNIKTINNQSLLGSGDITIGGGGTATDVQVNGTSITSGGVANLVTESAYNASTNKIATKSDIPTNTSALNNDSGFITTETDPVFSSSPAAGITNANITQWNAAEVNVQSDWLQTSTSADDYIKNKPSSVVLYNNPSGSNGTINLSDSAANYNYITILFRNNDNYYDSLTVYQPNGKSISLISTNAYSTSRNYIKASDYSISGTTITRLKSNEVQLNNNASVGVYDANNHYIVRVIGSYDMVVTSITEKCIEYRDVSFTKSNIASKSAVYQQTTVPSISGYTCVGVSVLSISGGSSGYCVVSCAISGDNTVWNGAGSSASPTVTLRYIYLKN